MRRAIAATPDATDTRRQGSDGTSMDDWAEAITACVLTLTSASYAHFGVQLERLSTPSPTPAVRLVRTNAPSRPAARVVVRVAAEPRSRFC